MTYKEQANAVCKQIYGSTLTDLMIDDSEIESAKESGDTPEEFVKWLGDKYRWTTASFAKLNPDRFVSLLNRIHKNNEQR